MVKAKRLRRVFHSEVGKTLREMRMKRGWKFRQAVAIAHGRKLDAVTLNTLGDLEKGRTQTPDPKVLRAVAALYGSTYETLVSLFIQSLYGLKFNTAESDGGFVLLSNDSDTETAHAASYSDRDISHQAAHTREGTDVVDRRTVGGSNSLDREAPIDQRTLIAKALMEFAGWLDDGPRLKAILLDAATAIGVSGQVVPSRPEVTRKTERSRRARGRGAKSNTADHTGDNAIGDNKR